MNRYGQAITWGTLTAPQLCTGICTGFSKSDKLQRYVEQDMSGENLAIVQHGQKADISWSARVTAASTDFLDLSAGAAVIVTGISPFMLARKAVERWDLGQSKTISVEGTFYPALTQTSPVTTGAATAFTPATQSGVTTIYPGGALIWGTNPMGHSTGVLHMLEIAQELELTEDEEDPTGQILGVTEHGYLRTIQAHVLVKNGTAAPANGTVLALTNGPSNSANYRIESVETIYAEKKGLMYQMGGVWIPPFD